MVMVLRHLPAIEGHLLNPGQTYSRRRKEHRPAIHLVGYGRDSHVELDGVSGATGAGMLLDATYNGRFDLSTHFVLPNPIRG